MVNIIIIHGAYGNPKENWFPWLKQELEKLDHKVFVPKFPTPKDQNLNSWLKIFDNYKKYLDKDSIIIGHSIGVAFILSLLEKHKVKVAFLVAGFVGKLNIEFDEINRTFAEKEFDWKLIKNNCKKLFIYNSDDDPYVPLEKGKELADKLNSKLTIIKNAGHFNEEAGYIKFEKLLKDIKKES